MRVLLVKTSSMGDVIHTFPAVTDALRHRPDLILDWCVEPAFLDLARLHPGVRAACAAPVRDWLKRPFAGATLAEIRALRRCLRRENYDLVLDAQGLIKSAVLAKLAGTAISGFDSASAREGAASFLYRSRFRVRPDLHAIQRTRLLFGAALGYAPDLSRVDSGLAIADAHTPRPRVFLLHGTSRPGKEWPLENWIAIARALAAKGMTPVVTWASQAELRTAEAIAASAPETSVIPKSPLSSIAVEIERSALVIGVDTGLTHLADAYGRPTVALFLGSNPELTGPVGRRSIVLSPQSGALERRPRRRDRAMGASVQISVEAALRACDRALSRSTEP